jgi:hypothetical protein
MEAVMSPDQPLEPELVRRSCGGAPPAYRDERPRVKAADAVFS